MEPEVERATAQLIAAIEDMGYPREFGVVLAGELRSEHAMQRMTSDLRQTGSQPPEEIAQPPEEIADEMLAICADRDRWVEQKKSEYANAKITEFYNRPREPEEDS